MPLIVCASPAHLAIHGRPGDPMALTTHNCLIDENPADAAAWRFRKDARDIVVKTAGAFHANTPAAIANMAIASLGNARCPRSCWICHFALTRRKLGSSARKTFGRCVANVGFHDSTPPQP
ncbi:LysR substrate-binding domain-containing protein [Roseovarius aestuarii]|uniref:LysR substrate-binding domain-containing protein n=1 Tax=Roseovarius aestuarii TaxID=475083 RepID=UPI000A26CCD3